jgi:16S rRNA (adenine1518-N6/adenine1519-N6)-dimethyltransferase
VTLSPRDVRDVLEAHGLRPKRALGQNFVADANTVRRIARLADVHGGDSVVEIGAGLGSLTVALAETGARVVAVEIDDRLLPALRTLVAPLGVEVVHGDALRLDFQALLAPRHRSESDRSALRPWSLVANLPYNVAVPVVARVLDDVPEVQTMLVMVQREVGERLAAGPGDDAYGAVSVKVAYHSTARVVGRVPASVFVPRPKVESVLVQFTRRPHVAVDPDVVSAQRLFTVVRAGFAHRRKMLRGALAGVVQPEAFAPAGIDPKARAEDLSVEDFGRLTACDLEVTRGDA